MQQQAQTPTDGEQQREPEWELASYGQRVGAWALDFVGGTLPLILLLYFVQGIMILPFILTFLQLVFPTTGFFSGAAVGSRVVGTILAIIFTGYIVWWLFALRRGQTPGKQIVGIRIVTDNGELSGWGYTFLREFVIKSLLVGFLSGPTLGIARLVDYLWPLWDREKKMQTLHDKLLGTLVVRNRG